MRSSFVFLAFVLIAHCFRESVSDSGRDIVEKLYQYRSKCKEPTGSSWVPLPDGLKCGTKFCDYPKEWCAIRSKDELPDLFCDQLSSTCQEALKQGGGGKPETKIISSASQNSAEDEEATEATKKPTRPTTTEKPSSEEQLETAGSSKISLQCQDFHDICCYWAASGECDRNPIWMKRSCRKSCGVCNCSPATAELCPTQVNIDNCRWLVPPPGSPLSGGPVKSSSGGFPVGVLAGGPPVPANQRGQRLQFGIPRPPTVGPVNPSCQDRQPLCRFWASTGQCGLNRVFMSFNCPASCGFC